MADRPEADEDRLAERRASRATAILLIGVGVTGMGAFLAIQQVVGGDPVWDKDRGVYWSRLDSFGLGMAMMLAGTILWWLGLRWSDRARR